METVLVTGGGGFLGKAIVKKLLARGDEVTSFSRRFHPGLQEIGADQIQGNIADAEAVKIALAGVDIVYHVAAKAGIWGGYDGYYQANVIGTQSVINGCLETGVSRLVYTSSPSVVFDGSDMEGADESAPYPDCFHGAYPETKAIAEKLVRDSVCPSLATITLRPHLIWGPGDNHLVPRIIKKAKRLKRVGDGKNLVDTIYVGNAADAHILAGDHLEKDSSLSGNVYFISQDEPVRLWSMIDDILGAAGLDPVKGAVSANTAWWAGRLFDFFFKALGIKTEPPMTAFVAKELATSHWFDISKVKRDLGYAPVISTQEGLDRLQEWLRRGEKK